MLNRDCRDRRRTEKLFRAVGMSTVAEVIAANHAGLRVAGMSCITNLGTGLSKVKLTHEDVKEVAKKVEKNFSIASLI